LQAYETEAGADWVQPDSPHSTDDIRRTRHVVSGPLSFTKGKQAQAMGLSATASYRGRRGKSRELYGRLHRRGQETAGVSGCRSIVGGPHLLGWNSMSAERKCKLFWEDPTRFYARSSLKLERIDRHAIPHRNGGRAASLMSRRVAQFISCNGGPHVARGWDRPFVGQSQ
jgi:hypothetical protein